VTQQPAGHEAAVAVAVAVVIGRSVGIDSQ
jgi:hypothetical protein